VVKKPQAVFCLGVPLFLRLRSLTSALPLVGNGCPANRNLLSFFGLVACNGGVGNGFTPLSGENL